MIKKGHLISQVPECIIYLESESDVMPICPQLRKTNKTSILNFARVGDAISFCYYDYLCKIEPQKLPTAKSRTISTTFTVCGTLLPYKTTTTEVIYNNDSYNRLLCISYLHNTGKIRRLGG